MWDNFGALSLQDLESRKINYPISHEILEDFSYSSSIDKDVYNGGGTVKVCITDASYDRPTDALLTKVQTLIDPEQNQGLGVGLAPIGHVVTIESAVETIVNLEATLTLQSGYTLENMTKTLNSVVKGYYKELAATWEEVTEPLVVRMSQIEMRILNMPGVIDVGGTMLNGVGQNLVLLQDSLPVKGDCIWREN